MPVRVVMPPAPFLTPADIPGAPSPTDAAVTLMIAAAVEALDGPTGWLGRAIGPQTLEMALPGFGWDWVRLYCPPIISITSLTYLDAAGARQTVAPSAYQRVGDVLGRAVGASWPSTSGAVIITYQAGYDGSTTGAVPARVKQAVIMAVQNMMALSDEELSLRSETVEGIGAQSYAVSDVTTNLIRQTADRLLRGLKVYRV